MVGVAVMGEDKESGVGSDGAIEELRVMLLVGEDMVLVEGGGGLSEKIPTMWVDLRAVGGHCGSKGTTMALGLRRRVEEDVENSGTKMGEVDKLWFFFFFGCC